MSNRKQKEIDNEVEILLCFSKGAETRKRILKSLQYRQKNCNQIAKELGLDWWSVQKHLQRLKKVNLMLSLKIGRIEFYKMSSKCKAALEVLNIQNFRPNVTK